MTDSDQPRKEWTRDEIIDANLIRGPRSADEAKRLVDEGVLTDQEAAFLQENRRRVDAYLARDFERRLRALSPADLLKLEHAFKDSSRPRLGGRKNMDTDPHILSHYALFLERRRREPRLALKYFAARIGVKYGTLKRWHLHFQGKLPSGADESLREQAAN